MICCFAWWYLSNFIIKIFFFKKIYLNKMPSLKIDLIIFFVVRMVGLEPTRCCHRGILNPLRLPIPPHPQKLNINQNIIFYLILINNFMKNSCSLSDCEVFPNNYHLNLVSEGFHVFYLDIQLQCLKNLELLKSYMLFLLLIMRQYNFHDFY